MAPGTPTVSPNMKAKSKPRESISLQNCGLKAEQLKPLVQIKEYVPPPERKAGKKLDGNADEAAKELVRLLREEAKVI